MKRAKIIFEVSAMARKVTIEDVRKITESIKRPVEVRLEERHYTEPEPIKCPRCGAFDVYKP